MCTAALFFFPAVHGSYASVHGPVTTLRSIKARVRIWIGLATRRLMVFLLPCLGAPLRAQRHVLFFGRPLFFPDSAVLRC